MVHCRVVALSVSALQNGTKRFSSSQQMRILRLQTKPRQSHGRADAGPRKNTSDRLSLGREQAHLGGPGPPPRASPPPAAGPSRGPWPPPRPARTPWRAPCLLSWARSKDQFKRLDQGWAQTPGNCKQNFACVSSGRAILSLSRYSPACQVPGNCPSWDAQLGASKGPGPKRPADQTGHSREHFHHNWSLAPGPFVTFTHAPPS